MEFSKLNMFGNAIKPKQMPYLSPKNTGQQVLEVTYGHNDNGGKRYTYVGNTHRTGDIVTPFVTSPKSGKTYRTLAVVRATHSLKAGEGNLKALSESGIPVKKIGATHQTWLPGYKAQKEADPAFTAKQWAENAKQKNENNVMKKINHYGDTVNG